MSEISDLLKKVVDFNVKLPEVCRVVPNSFSETYFTVDAIRYYDPEYGSSGSNDIDRTITDVRLNILRDGNYSVPADNSFILVMWDEQDVPYCIMINDMAKDVRRNITEITTVTREKNYTESANVNIVGTTSITIDGKTIELNGMNYGGLVIIDALIEKINRLENAFNTHVHTSAAPGIPTTPSLTIITPITVKSDLENTKIKHGNDEPTSTDQ